MAISIGDRVRFLDAEGGGIVVRIDGRTLYVEDADGFEYPTTEAQVVVVEQHAAQRQEQHRKQQIEQQRIREQSVAEIEAEPDYNFDRHAADDDNPQFYIAFTRADGGNSGYINLHVVNDSNCFVFFTLAEQLPTDATRRRLLHHGTIEPNTKLKLDRLNPQRIDNQTWHCQLLLFLRHDDYRASSPVDTEIKIRASRFMRDGAFLRTDFFSDKAVLLPVIKDELQRKIEQLSDADMHRAIDEKQQKPVHHTSKSNDPRQPIEVDLHIDAIVESTAGLQPGEMLALQIARFKHVMEENIDHKGRRIVFIHGVGQGTLKAEVRRILQRDYSRVNFYDASFQEYGFGATMVVI